MMTLPLPSLVIHSDKWQTRVRPLALRGGSRQIAIEHARASATAQLRMAAYHAMPVTAMCVHFGSAFVALAAALRYYRHVALWRRNDFISDPSAAPPSHGDICFNETDLIWYTPDAAASAEVAMFPGRQRQRRWFTQSPSSTATRRTGP
jgi:hypothetical protein